MIQRAIYNNPNLINKVQNNQTNSIPNSQRFGDHPSFSEIFNNKIKGDQSLTFSAHAEQRLMQRNIALNQNDFAKLESAVSQLESKGGKESLIMMNDVSYVVNIPNRKVITAVDSVNSSQKIFTNIDSAMII
jgi:flagellar operon protein